MIILNKTQSISFSEDINELLCEIDTKLSRMSENKLNSERYGACQHINMEDHRLLYKYRGILFGKAKGYCCYQNICLEDIISRIKQLLNRN